MYLLAKFGGHRSHRNGDINSYINSYMKTSEIAELTTSLSHIEGFSKSRIPIYNPEVPDTAGRKTTARRAQTIKVRYLFHTNALKLAFNKYNNSLYP